MKEVLAALATVVFTIIYEKRADIRLFILKHIERFDAWANTPIELKSSTGIVASLRLTPASLTKTYMVFHVWVTRLLYHIYIFLISMQLAFIGYNEAAIRLAIVAYIVFFILGEIMFRCFPLLASDKK
jgi:hypothetical protein